MSTTAKAISGRVVVTGLNASTKICGLKMAAKRSKPESAAMFSQLMIIDL